MSIAPVSVWAYAGAPSASRRVRSDADFIGLSICKSAQGLRVPADNALPLDGREDRRGAQKGPERERISGRVFAVILMKRGR